MKLLATICLVFVTCARAVAQSPQSLQITEVRFEQEDQIVTDPSLSALIETKVGQPLSMRQVRESETHLMSLNRFETMEVAREETPGGIRLVYRLFPLHPVDRLEFRGNLGVGEGTLRQVVRERFGSAPSATRLTQIVALLEQEYRDRGYPGAVVKAEITQRHEPHRSTLVIVADAGRRVLIKALNYPKDESEKDVFVGLPDLSVGEPYDREHIVRELDQYVDTMRGKGYYEANADPAPPQFDPDGVVVTIALRRGPRVQVVFTGDRLSKSEQERLVPVRDEASVAEELLENWSRAIESYLRGRGYKDAKAPFGRTQKEGELTITFAVARGPRYLVDSISLTGGAALTKEELGATVRMKEGAPFVESELRSSAVAIRDIYRSRGFTKATVEPVMTVLPPERSADMTLRVQTAINIMEGPRTLVRSLTFSGNTVTTDDDLRALTTIGEGQPLSGVQIERSRTAIVRHYQDRGFENIAVQATPVLVEADTQADVHLSLSEGPQIIIDQIIIDGNERTSRRTIERELLVKPGEPLGYSALVESRARLRATGLFRQIEIDERPHLGETRRDLVVRVQEAAATTLGFGGGLEIGSRLRPNVDGTAQERTEFVPRAFFEIGRRNMWGKNRSVNLFTRVSLRSKDTVTRTGPLDSDYGVNEYRVYGTYREPKVFSTTAVILFTAIAERAIRTSFSFVTREARSEVVVQRSQIYSAVFRHSIEHTELFDVDPNLPPEEQPVIDRLFPQVRLSKLFGTLIRNTRDDQLDPSRGLLLSADGEIAARAIGSEVGYVKTFLQGSWYRQLPFERRMVLALRGILGAAHGFPREVRILDENGAPATDPDGSPAIQTVQDLPASERFFAGGPTTHRGFSLDRLGNEDTIAPSGFPTGGSGEIILNGELRVGLLQSVAGVVFVDAGNVFRRAADLSLTELRPAVGFGFHYRSPVGPVRAEIGFNLDRRELTPGQLERGYVLNFSLGPAF